MVEIDAAGFGVGLDGEGVFDVVECDAAGLAAGLAGEGLLGGFHFVVSFRDS